MPVPISFGYLAIFLTLYVPGTKQGFISYLIGFFFMSGITGFSIDRWPGSDFYADEGRGKLVLTGQISGSITT